MSHKPLVLVTNDDGIDSPGLHALIDELVDGFELIVAAPRADMSGSGTGIGRFDVSEGVELTPIDIRQGMRSFSIDGPPGLAVTAAALGAFGDMPDLVMSGINAGMNTGHSIIHSGTVGAALTARTFGMRGIALSLSQSDPWYWETAAHFAPALVHWLLDRQEPRVLNVNVPGVPIDEVAGARWADLDDFGYIRVATADVEDRRLQFVVRSSNERSDPGSDTVLCSENYVTLTPLRSVEPAPYPPVHADEVLGGHQLAESLS
ncbi:MAG TPA: 5'/3'-nucleotidase SurE [Acidimicrobiia bacterium]|nr:5'/3'-nucleotidase SurE [Acidimicrobiia bacterium]